MTAISHLDALINSSYFNGDESTYRALMAHKAVAVAEDEKRNRVVGLHSRSYPEIRLSPQEVRRIGIGNIPASWKLEITE